MKFVVTLLACTFATFVAGTKTDEYQKAALRALNKQFLRAMATTAVQRMVDISNKPQLQLFAKIRKKPDADGNMLYDVEISLKKPQSIKGINITVVQIKSRDDLKQAFVDALTNFLLPLTPPIGDYEDAVNNFGKNQRKQVIEKVVRWLRLSSGVRHVFTISKSPKLLIGWEIKRVIFKYRIYIFLYEPKSIPGSIIPRKHLIVRISKLRTGLTKILNEFLSVFKSKG